MAQNYRHWLGLGLSVMLLLGAGPSWSDELEVTAPGNESPQPIEILRAADALFSRQGIHDLGAKMVVYRDSADHITLEELGAERLQNTTLVPLQGRYQYWDPHHYNFWMLGYLVASSEMKPGVTQSFTSPLLPLPGGILSSPSIQERFRLRLSEPQAFPTEKGPVDCHVLRMYPRKAEAEFFKTLTYYISVAEPHLIHGVRATFSDGGSWSGTGWGTFYYKEDRQGRTLPFIGVGEINFRNPNRKVILKGKWRDFAVNSGQVEETIEEKPQQLEEVVP